MVTRRSSSDISAPNFHGKPITDNELIRGSILALRPVGARKVAQPRKTGGVNKAL
jgi:hypothetical protein